MNETMPRCPVLPALRAALPAGAVAADPAELGRQIRRGAIAVTVLRDPKLAEALRSREPLACARCQSHDACAALASTAAADWAAERIRKTGYCL